jgi:hypothetical protein
MTQNTINKKRLTKKDVEELLTSKPLFKGELSEIYSKHFEFEINIYQMPDENFLMVYLGDDLKGKGDIWKKDYIEKELLRIEVNDENDFHLSNTEHWYKYSKNKAELVNQTEVLIKQIFSDFNLENNIYNLTKLSQELNKIEREKLFDYYDNIVALTGEIFINEINGEWKIQNDNNGFEITIENGTYFSLSPVTPFWKILIENSEVNLPKYLNNELRESKYKIIKSIH